MELCRRTTVILGAGSILDFDFQGREKPTSARMLDVMLGKNATNKKDFEFINEIYDQLCEVIKAKHINAQPWTTAAYKPNMNFEELFDAVEVMMSYAINWSDQGELNPLIVGLIQPKEIHSYQTYYAILRTSLRVIMDEVNLYNNVFRINNKSEIWYRQFWSGFNGEADIFNLNYDTTIEDSLENNYEDGFVPCHPEFQKFDPVSLLSNPRNVSTVNHLHGCIMYSDIPLLNKNRGYYDKHDLFKYYDYRGLETNNGLYIPISQSGEGLVWCPIITGLHKTDKICFMPQNFYHTNFANCILQNSSLLIAGYSFGDIYINQLIERHKLIHGDNQKLVLIDFWTPNMYKGIYHYYRVAEGNNSRYMKFFENITGIRSGCQLQTILENAPKVHEQCFDITPTFRIYTCGFKNAVTQYQTEIFEYLRGQKKNMSI